MKKVLLIALLSAASIVANAQRYEYGPPQPMDGPEGDIGRLRFGVFLAPTVSWLKPTANKSDDKLYIVNSEGSKAGFSWGLMMDYYFEPNYGIATGFSITSGGGKISTRLNPNVTPPYADNIVESTYFDYKLQYFDIPFALKLRTDELPGGIRLVGQLGISASFAVSKRADYEVTYTDIDASGNTVEKTVKADKEKIEGTGITPVLMQLNIGAGVEYPITEKLSLYGSLFFNNGFAPDVTSPKDLDLDYKGKFSDGNTRLNNIALRIGIFF